MGCDEDRLRKRGWLIAAIKSDGKYVAVIFRTDGVRYCAVGVGAHLDEAKSAAAKMLKAHLGEFRKHEASKRSKPSTGRDMYCDDPSCTDRH